jgi:hypothetical protein
MLNLTRRAFLASPAVAALAQTSPAPPSRRLLESQVTAAKLEQVLLPRSSWRPYPTISDRGFWEGLPSEVRSAVVESAGAQLGKPWPVLPASVFLEYARNGNRSRFESLSFARRNRLRHAALAECMEARGRFLDEILDGIWCICEESFWGVPAHVGAQKAGNTLPDVTEPVVDLFAAETANTLAWTDYLVGSRLESLSKVLRPRVRLEIERRILEPALSRDDFWWMGFGGNRAVNNWNPWINSNWLACALLIEPDPGRRVAAVHKIIRSLDRFLDGYHEDGGCDEGPSYWSRAAASLLDCLELLDSASGGRLNFFGIPLVREMGAYIYRAHIAGDWYVNFADASARLRPNGNLVWRFGKRVQDPRLEAHGAWLASRSTSPLERFDSDGMRRALDALVHLEELSAASRGARPPLVRDVFLPGVQMAAARLEEGSERGFYLAAQGGHNAESHNHNDVGNFIVFCDGEPVLIDIGVETYTAQTFSARRYEIWTMQSAWHNCPTINGQMQAAGRQYEARNFAALEGGVAMEIQRAYPDEAGVQRWQRTVLLERGADRVVVRDSFQLSRRESVEWNFISNRVLRASGPGQVVLDKRFVLEFDPTLEAVFDEHSSEDARLRPIWGAVVRRVQLRLKNPPAQGEYVFRLRRI